MENNFLAAASKMGGNGTIGSKDRQFSKEEVISIIEATQEMMKHNSKYLVTRRLNDLKGAVRDGHYELDTILHIMRTEDPTASEGGVLGSLTGLNNIQVLRLRREYPIKCDNCELSDRFDFTQEEIETIKLKYQEKPNHPSVYYGAEKSAVFFKCYKDSWLTHAFGDNAGYAWSYDGNVVRLISFYDGIFDAGLILPKEVLSELHSLANGESESITINETTFAGTTFVCTEDEQANFYHCYINDDFIVSLSSRVLKGIVSAVESEDVNLPNDISYFTQWLKTVQEV